MGEALRGAAGDGRAGRGAAARRLSERLGALVVALALLVLAAVVAVARPVAAQGAADGDTAALRLDAGRFTVLAYPQDERYARELLGAALARDTFPGLPRPTRRVVIGVAPDERRFRAWVGPAAPHWGEAIAFPRSHRIVVRGRGAGAARSAAPFTVLRHELAHLALHEALGELTPRWFDEGYASYAAAEWGREQVLATNVALLFRRVPALDALDARLTGGAREAEGAYALSYRAVAELAALDPERGLTLLFRYWKETARLDPAVRRAYGLTLDAFEERWQRRTRIRYGVLALVGDLGAGIVLAIAVMVPLAHVRRRRDRARMAALRAADLAADAVARSEARAAAAAAAATVDPAGGDPALPRWEIGESTAPVPDAADPSPDAPR